MLSNGPRLDATQKKPQLTMNQYSALPISSTIEATMLGNTLSNFDRENPKTAATPSNDNQTKIENQEPSPSNRINKYRIKDKNATTDLYTF